MILFWRLGTTSFSSSLCARTVGASSSTDDGREEEVRRVCPILRSSPRGGGDPLSLRIAETVTPYSLDRVEFPTFQPLDSSLSYEVHHLAYLALNHLLVKIFPLQSSCLGSGSRRGARSEGHKTEGETSKHFRPQSDIHLKCGQNCYNGELLVNIVYFRCRPQRYLPRIPPDFRRCPCSETVKSDSDLLKQILSSSSDLVSKVCG